MKNITLTIQKTVYENRQFATQNGFAVSAEYVYEDSSNRHKVAGGIRRPVVSILDEALEKVVDTFARQYDTAAVTVVLPAGYVLSDSLKAHFVDKYTLENEITSITFA